MPPPTEENRSTPTLPDADPPTPALAEEDRSSPSPAEEELPTPRSRFGSRLAQLNAHFADPQHRNAYYLMLNSITGAAAGLLFWLLFTRILELPAAQVGVGYVVVALGTMVGVLAKGGLDTALLRTVPGASSQQARSLLFDAVLIGLCASLLFTVAMGGFAGLIGGFPGIDLAGWGLVAAIGSLLVLTWLQDAYFLAEGSAKPSFLRNVTFSVARLALPLLLFFILLPHAVAVTWAVALALSALAAAYFMNKLPQREGRDVSRKEFVDTAWRNVTGSAAEFLPGLLLAPVVLVLLGESASGYFGIAWTAASLLFLASAAICRSALAEMVRHGPDHYPLAIKRAAKQHLQVVAPGIFLGALLAPEALLIFGREYSINGAPLLILLCASTFFVAPSFLYLALLRARDKPKPLILFPAFQVLALAILTPLLILPGGLTGVALAWLAANIPFGLYSLVKLRLASREVTNLGPRPDPATNFPGTPHLE